MAKKILVFSLWRCIISYVQLTGKDGGAGKCQCPSKNMHEFITYAYENLSLSQEKNKTADVNQNGKEASLTELGPVLIIVEKLYFLALPGNWVFEAYQIHRSLLTFTCEFLIF